MAEQHFTPGVGGSVQFGAGAVDAVTQRMTLASDDPAVAKLTTIDGRVDGIEALLTTIDGRVDGVETLLTDILARVTSTQGQLLASAARTANTASPTQTTPGVRGVMIGIKITVFPNTTETLGIGYNPRINSLPVTQYAGTFTFPDGVALTALGAGPHTFTVSIGQGCDIPNSYFHGAIALPVPVEWAVAVLHSAGSSWTYELNYAVLLG
jgi:hypothetical protein